MDPPPSPSKGKGKLKEFSSEFDDLDPVVTYRHIFSSTIGPKHPLRVVALCDCNAFYANCEQVRLGIDPEKPLVVAQWGMLIAVNYPTREFGISRMDKPHEAVKRCKDLIVVHVATYAEGELEPKYHEKPDAKTHKVRPFLSTTDISCLIVGFLDIPRLIPKGVYQSRKHVQGESNWRRDR